MSSARPNIDARVAQLSAAIRELTAGGERRRAAMACVELGQTYENALCNLTAARAWFARAARLLEHEPPCIEQGWVAIAAMGCDVDDPGRLLTGAELALERARRFGDVNLETKALADAGLAHVQCGRTSQGMALLDEAMALACGPANDSSAAAKSVCSFFTACYHAADFARASSWTAPLEQHGLLGSASGGAIFLSSHCESVQATLLMELGRWREAEAVLLRSIEVFEASMPFPAWHPALALADLRVRQGRLGEAEALLLGKDQALQGLLPTARLHLARGDAALARAAALRGLRGLGADRLRAIELWVVVVEAALALGEHEAATRAAGELGERARDLSVPSLAARAALVRARVALACGEARSARALLESAVDALNDAQLPWMLALLTLELARTHQAMGDRAAAVVEARAAKTLLSTLEVVLSPEDAQLLERLAAPASESEAPPKARGSLERQDRWWSVTCGNSNVRFPDGKGMRYLAELLAKPGVEQHALDLVDRLEGVDEDGLLDRRALAGSGPQLDARARADYRRRIEELRSAADDAIERGQLEAAEAAQNELEQLVAQLSQAFGLGGKDRPTGSAAERARLNVTRALRSALARIGEALPEAGSELDRRVRTGLYCAYEPRDEAISWVVQCRVNDLGEP
jgi:tetratricopeptide (TPR) repeat protein